MTNNQQQGGGCCWECEDLPENGPLIRCIDPLCNCHQPTPEKQESHEGVEELIAAADSHMQKAMPILDKFERASMLNWLREKLTNLNTKKHE